MTRRKKAEKPTEIRIEKTFTAHRYQDELFANWKRFNVAITCRGWGKTVAAVMALHTAAINSPIPLDFAYIAPVKAQAWDVIGPVVLQFLSHLERIDVGGGKMKDGPLKIKSSDKEIHYSNGCKIKAYGADYPNNKVIRGKTFGGVVVDEFDDTDFGVWLEIISPCLRTHKGWALMIGTVKPGSNLYRLEEEFSGDKDWQTKIYKFEDCWQDLPAYDEDEFNIIIARFKNDPNKYAREYQCDPTASDDDVVIPTDIIYAASGKHMHESVYSGLVKVMGVDVATGGGSDKSSICKRHGLMCHPIAEYNLDNMDFADVVAREIDLFEPDAVFIDKGRGEGVISRLRHLGYKVIGIDFGSTAIRTDIYRDRRVEMYHGGIKGWLENGGALPPDKQLIQELAAPCLKPSDGKFIMERKVEIKKRLGRSPDKADALALTFAAPVSCRATGKGRKGIKVNNCSNFKAMGNTQGYRRR